MHRIFAHDIDGINGIAVVDTVRCGRPGCAAVVRAKDVRSRIVQPVSVDGDVDCLRVEM